MKKIKEKIGKLLILFCICLSVGAVANAADKASTDVEITIEAEKEEGIANNETNNAVPKQETDAEIKSVQTGDKTAWVKYVVAIGIAVFAIACVWKKKKKTGTLAIVIMFFALLFTNRSVMAADAAENVNLTVPTTISISFDESGENHISEFEVCNQTLVPIKIQKVYVTEYNQWSLVEKGSEIPTDTKKFALSIEETCLCAGENSFQFSVPAQKSEALDISIERGAFTKSSASEKALGLEFEYTLGRSWFNLYFDTNGSDTTINAKQLYNGQSTTLPTVEREGYELAGWEDEKGNVYTEHFIMPIGDVTLKARWKEKIAYAIYSESDTSLRFVRTADPINVGDSYNGRKVTAVFTGFEDDTYSSFSEVPWYDGNKYADYVIKQVVFEDVIKPISTAYWFYNMIDCTKLEVSKLDMSQVTNMSCMFAWTGSGRSVTKLEIIGIDSWDVSKVTQMESTFRNVAFFANTFQVNLSKWDVSSLVNAYELFDGAGYFATSFSLGDLSGWDVSNVTDMGGMFQQAGYSATWSMNLSKWNVKKVTYYKCFCLAIESKITQPKWVN